MKLASMARGVVFVSLLLLLAWIVVLPAEGLDVILSTQIPLTQEGLSLAETTMVCELRTTLGEVNLVGELVLSLPNLGIEELRISANSKVHDFLITSETKLTPKGFITERFGVSSDLGALTVSAQAELEITPLSGQIHPLGRTLELIARPMESIEFSIHTAFGIEGLQHERIAFSFATSYVNASYILEVDRQRRWCKTLTLTSPLLLDAGILHSITHEYGITVGDTVSSETKIIPPVLDLGKLNELKLPFGKEPVFKSVTESKNQGLEQGRPQLPDCEIADVQVQQDEVYDFGDVTVGTTAYLEIPLGCLYHDFCWLEAIVQYPSAPFQVVSAPIGEPIYRGGRKTIGVRFTPQGCGYFSGTLIVRYCYGNFPEEEPHPMHLGGKGDLNPQWFRCIEVPCYLHGRAVGPPIARCSHRPEHPTPGETVFFSSQGSYACDPEGILARYEWDFDDGSTSHLPNPTHRFAKVGTYMVGLTVWDNTGYQSQLCWCRVEVAPDVAELVGAATVAVVAGVASHAVLSKPPVLPPPAFGFAAALVPASIVAISEFCSYPVDQLIVGLPEGISLSEARRLVRDIVPDAEIVGFSAPLSACLVRFPSLQAIADQEQAVRVLEKMSDEFEKRMPEGAWVLKNYLGTPEQIEDSATFRCDLGKRDENERKAYETIGAFEAWELLSHLRVQLKPIRVAVIDSGIHAKHARNEFDICLTGVSHVKAESNADNAETKEFEYEPWYEDPIGHGTEISGIIGAENSQGNMNGILAGACCNYELQVHRVACDLFSQLESVRFAASDQRATPLRSEACEAAKMSAAAVVINLSIGWDSKSTQTELPLATICEIWEKLIQEHGKTLFVSSAGNGDEPEHRSISKGLCLVEDEPLHAPGGISAPNNITVAATDSEGRCLEDWSNYGPAVDIAAPGDCVYTTDNKDSYAARTRGTSYSTALVAGTAGLLLAIEPSLIPEEVKQILVETGTKLEGETIPLLNVRGAVGRALEMKKERDAQRLLRASLIGTAALAAAILILRPF